MKARTCSITSPPVTNFYSQLTVSATRRVCVLKQLESEFNLYYSRQVSTEPLRFILNSTLNSILSFVSGLTTFIAGVGVNFWSDLRRISTLSTSGRSNL
jgi:hypothetical protein